MAGTDAKHGPVECYAVHKKQPLMHIMQALMHNMHKTAPYGVHKTSAGPVEC